MEQKVKLILKGILLHTTIVLSMLFAMGIDSIYDKGFFVEAVIIIGALIFTCSKVLTEKECNKILFTEFFNKL